MSVGESLSSRFSGNIVCTCDGVPGVSRTITVCPHWSVKVASKRDQGRGRVEVRGGGYSPSLDARLIYSVGKYSGHFPSFLDRVESSYCYRRKYFMNVIKIMYLLRVFVLKSIYRSYRPCVGGVVRMGSS